MQKGFTLIEMLLGLILFGILGVLGGLTLLKIYQNYSYENRNFIQELQAQNALLQIKNLLENSHLASLMIVGGEEISTSLSSIKGKSLVFYEKEQEYALVGNYALPCLHGIFAPQSIAFANASSGLLELEFLNLDSNSQAILNQQCLLYQTQNIPQNALFTPAHFIAPKDFYHSKFQGRIVSLNAHKILLEVPPFLKDFMQTQTNPSSQNAQDSSKNASQSQPALLIAPKIYFLNQASSLHFGDSIVLESQKQFPKIPQNSQEILQNIADFKIAKTPLGIALELCILNAESALHCVSTLVVELER
ncbi:prepilin-type N-terminal cleavage/methylation domain-containing protein [Helicobacter sp. MIT 05-5294]|uniref:prepilin-type N-terminal cleavage/methylation domain-containing protein n=1 Tax=Helicobacter sp. MIT 05-5294 TaxID=1548150 RepID=UPI00051FDE10|nr:prepilin-type N-terminal cleavage/methylation domain-containing protein [Helicobacter sp. MIT 05-5294]TLD85432.1 prepilin-type N-terminal cleavage/methylation domain-containing protein [Helicobacter sp. MIT 05-5294]